METKSEKLLRRSLFAVASLLDYKTTLLLSTPMAVSQLYASIAQQNTRKIERITIYLLGVLVGGHNKLQVLYTNYIIQNA